MKKTYVKPALAVESFVLSQSIANDCGAPGGGTVDGKPGIGSRETCGWQVGDWILWISERTECQIPTSVDDPVNGYICYNTPDGGYMIFGS